MARRSYHHGDLRGALLEAAESLVRERGVDGWSLREVSARIGVSPSAAYHHFDSRDALVRTLSAVVLARLGERLARVAGRAREQRADPQQRLIAVGRGYVRWALEDPSVASLAFNQAPEHRDGPETPLSPHPHDVLVTELDRLVDAGGLTASARPGAEFILWAALHGLATLLGDGLMRFDSARAVDREAERLVRAVLTGLAAESPGASHRPQARSAHTERLKRRDP
ncbi:TetR/AcrR family transcriptional regulator [Amycolatopsis nigrescens]|uniref:TetR/AcrR family transcriptional regulator n=1 Tax=Amycolatopsis nigrescens TaxID=381445 RepID=UPI00037F4B5C|nr:TetR/AcrR family transcriptional regulator [Amycolatopsis nigrescens]